MLRIILMLLFPKQIQRIFDIEYNKGYGDGYDKGLHTGQMKQVAETIGSVQLIKRTQYLCDRERIIESRSN